MWTGLQIEERSEQAGGQRHGSAGWKGPGPTSLLQQGHPGAHGTGPHPPPMTPHPLRGESTCRNRRPGPRLGAASGGASGVLPTPTCRAVAGSRMPPTALIGRRAPRPAPALPTLPRPHHGPTAPHPPALRPRRPELRRPSPRKGWGRAPPTSGPPSRPPGAQGREQSPHTARRALPCRPSPSPLQNTAFPSGSSQGILEQLLSLL